MASKATITVGWKLRPGAMAVLAFAMGAWFFYDGFVGYPGQQAVYSEYVAFSEKNKHLEPNKMIEQWDKLAEDKGYPQYKDVKGYEHISSWKVLEQKLFGIGSIIIGALAAYAFQVSLRRFVAVEDDGVRTAHSDLIPWSSITRLDKKHWPKKGIAWIHYQDKGVSRRILLDDVKFEREPINEILRAAESHLKDEQIEGDIRETERDRRKAEKADKEKAEAVATSAASAGTSNH